MASSLRVWVRYTYSRRPWLTCVFSRGESMQTVLAWTHRMVLTRPDVQSTLIERQYKQATARSEGSDG